VIVHALGKETYDVFRRAKRAEWEQFNIQVTDWKIDHYLETA